jgi:hypothetical protein
LKRAAILAALFVFIGVGLYATAWLSAPTPRAYASGSGVFRGAYLAGFELSDFYVEGANEVWWIEPGDWQAYLQETAESADRGCCGPIYVELEGVLSADGSYGHLGIYHRELTVARVLAVRPFKPGERYCGYTFSSWDYLALPQERCTSY